MMLSFLLLVGIILPINGIYQSTIVFSLMGLEYQPKTTIQLISTSIAQTMSRCSMACNQLPSCRILDYDSLSRQCRLFQGDPTTGSIIPSSSPTSVVGTVLIESNLYSSIHGQSCQACQQNRYQVCSTNTSTCQCPTHTYWTGSVCALQLLENAACSEPDMCRSDMNLSCGSYCDGYTPQCLPSVPFLYNSTTASSPMFGTTVAGACNYSVGSTETVLINQAGIALDANNTLYVGDNGNRIVAFTLGNLTATELMFFNNWPALMHFDNRTSSIYVAVVLSHLVYISPSNQTIPPDGIPGDNCSSSTLFGPTGIAVDSVGNVYISSLYCNWITKWAPNATTGVLFAGSPTGDFGWDAITLFAPYGIVLDEVHSFLYVADRYNYRIQRFPLNGSGIGVTVAGNNGEGPASNQIYHPTDVYLSKLDGSLYIVDCYNSRIQKWLVNATDGITVVGDPNGASGNTSYLLNMPYSFAFDSEEKYMYVSDSLNNRVQRFTLR